MSSLPYIQQLTKVIVAQITQTIGWNSIQTTPLELLTDILHKYLEELTRQTQRYTELYGRTEPNLDDIALAFNDLNINIADLEEYITNVDSVPCIVNVPKFPIPKESNLNFLKPGSREVVTRPVHIHEHLPPIQPHEETPPAEVAPVVVQKVEDEHNSTNIIQTYISTNQISDRASLDDKGLFGHETHDVVTEEINVIGETTVVENQTISASNDDATFRKPFDVPPKSEPNHRPAATNNNDSTTNANMVGKPTREIVSCFMTTGGFISPAREGKLPEAKKPIIVEEDPEPVPVEQRTPSPEIVERKHHSSKRDNKSDNNYDTSKNYGNEGNSNLDTYDEPHGKEVKLYEVIQTVPDALPKKKGKKSQLDIAQIKEQKKQKKLNQMKGNRFGKMGDPSNLYGNFVKEEGLETSTMNKDKLKKKMHKTELMQKKAKLKQFGASPYDINDSPEEKKRKKQMSKLSKKNMQELGLNPHAIEGFAIPPPPHDPYDHSKMMHDSVLPKDNFEKKKKQQKLSTEPDKQKIKFFKKMASASSNLTSKPNEDAFDRMVADPGFQSMASGSDANHHMAGGHGFGAGDEFDGAGSFGQMQSGMSDFNRTPPNLEDLPPSKKAKLIKKLNKQKEAKTPKIKKVKKDPLAKKQRTPKAAKLLDSSPTAMPKPTTPDANPMSKMFLNDEFNPQNIGMMNHFPVPGLNMNNPLFQSVRFDYAAQNPMQNFPFPPGMPNFDFANLSRFKRPNFNDPTQSNSEPVAKHPRDSHESLSKPLCNVAPLVHPSLLNMDMHRKDEHLPNTSMNESHSSQKHFSDASTSGSKKSVMFNNISATFGEQSYGGDKREPYDSPIVINSDDDDDMKHRHPSQSPTLDADHPFGTEVKKKKVKDKKDKEKKEKKDKDKDTGVVKMKKKKDKKDKSKNKEERLKTPKDKSVSKKEKREKKKERERLGTDGNDSMASNPFYGAQHSEWPRDSFSKEPDHSHLGDSSDMNPTFNNDSNLETVPKLTLKLPPTASSPSSRTSRPTTPDFTMNKKSSKKKKKQWRAFDDDSDKSDVGDGGLGGKASVTMNDSREHMREPSPELARISALITRPPKQKSSSKQADFSSPNRNEYFDQSAPVRSDYHSAMSSSTPLPATPSGRGRPKGSSSLKNKSKSTKSSASFADSEKKSQSFESSTSAVDPHAQNAMPPIDEQANEENQVWICPACGKVDDGTPMIGCDGCDDWYHWVCVGIQVPPNEDQDWFCRVCISRKQEDKKKKRKKKDKKDH